MRCRRPGRAVRLRLAVDHRRRERRSLSRTQFQSLRRRCGQRRGEPDHSARHHQFSFAFSCGRRGQLRHHAQGSSNWRARITSSTTWARISWFQTSNALPIDEFHLGVGGRKFWLAAQRQHAASRHPCITGVSATGVPNAWDFYHVTDNATEKDQDLYISASIDQSDHGRLSQPVATAPPASASSTHLWEQRRQQGVFDAFGDSLGEVVTITRRQRLLRYRARRSWIFPEPIRSGISLSPTATRLRTRATIDSLRTYWR